MRLRLAHSPDADDAFMFWGLASGTVASGAFEVEHVLRDIETLNAAARDGVYEVTAVSFAALPDLCDRYALLPSGASFGDGYGPLLVRRAGGTAPPADAPVAIPGASTSAAILLRLHRPGVRIVVMPFDRIGGAILRGEVAAGVLIHEGQLTYVREGLEKVVDLGAWWKSETGLPVPLGGNVALRSLGDVALREVSRLVTDSIRASLSHRAEALAHAGRFGRGLSTIEADRFVGMYVNDRTLAYGETELRALDEFYGRALEAGWIARKPPFREDLRSTA